VWEAIQAGVVVWRAEGGSTMNGLPLEPEERELLDQLLKRSLADLDLEILHTDHAEFRGMLKARRELLQRLHRRLSEVPAGLGS
jgi:hypothetical protein